MKKIIFPLILFLVCSLNLLSQEITSISTGTNTVYVGGDNKSLVSSFQNNSSIVSISDNFNRADGLLGANWTHETGFFEGGASLGISGNQLIVTGPAAADSYYWWNANTLDTDQYSQITLVDVGNVVGPTYWWSGTPVRLTAGSHCYLGASFTSTDTEIYQIDTGAATAILSDNAATWVAGDILRTDVHGTSPARIYVSRNGLCVNEFLDFTFGYTGGQPGVGGLILSGSYTTPHMDNWSAGNITQPTISDNFNRANSILGINWICASISEYKGSGGLRISSNKVLQTNTGEWGIALWSWAQAQSQSSKVTIGTMGSADGEGVVIRASLLSSGNSYYLVFVTGATPSTTASVYAFSGGAYHLLTVYSGDTWTSGDTIKVTTTGSNPVTISTYHNDSFIGSTDDSTYKLTGSYIGVGVFSAAGTPSVDNFSGNEL